MLQVTAQPTGSITQGQQPEKNSAVESVSGLDLTMSLTGTVDTSVTTVISQRDITASQESSVRGIALSFPHIFNAYCSKTELNREILCHLDPQGALGILFSEAPESALALCDLRVAALRKDYNDTFQWCGQLVQWP